MPDSEIKAIASQLMDAFIVAHRRDRNVSLELLGGRLNREGWDHEVYEREGRDGPWRQVFGQHLTNQDLSRAPALVIAAIPPVVPEAARGIGWSQGPVVVPGKAGPVTPRE